MVFIGFLHMRSPLLYFILAAMPPTMMWFVNRTKSRTLGGFYSPDDNKQARGQAQVFEDSPTLLVNEL